MLVTLDNVKAGLIVKVVDPQERMHNQQGIILPLDSYSKSVLDKMTQFGIYIPNLVFFDWSGNAIPLVRLDFEAGIYGCYAVGSQKSISQLEIVHKLSNIQVNNLDNLVNNLKSIGYE